MKIIHAAETIKGGVATIMRQLILAQAAEHEVTSVIGLVPADQVSEMAPVAPGQLRVFRRANRGIMSMLRFGWAFARLVIVENPDVVHLHSTFAGALGRGILLVLKPVRRPKIVYCPHGWAFLMDKPRVIRTIYTWIERLLAPMTDAIVCISTYEKNAALVRGFAERRLVVIANGVAEPLGNVAKSPFSTQKVVQLLFVGRFDRQKGLDILLDSMQMLEGQKFHLTAVGSGVHNDELPQTRANVTYPGWLSAQELAAYYTHADVLVMPSRWESFGLVAAEAMSYGLPVLASRIDALPELVKEGVSGKLCDLNSADIAKTLQFTDIKDWRAMRTSARNHYEAHFATARLTREVHALYSRLLV